MEFFRRMKNAKVLKGAIVFSVVSGSLYNSTCDAMDIVQKQSKVSIKRIGRNSPEIEVYVYLRPLEGDAIKIRIDNTEQNQENIEVPIPDGIYFPEIRLYSRGGSLMQSMKTCDNTDGSDYVISNEFEVSDGVINLNAILQLPHFSCKGGVGNNKFSEVNKGSSMEKTPLSTSIQNAPEEVSPEEYEQRVDEFLSKLNIEPSRTRKNFAMRGNLILPSIQLTSLPNEIGNLRTISRISLENNELTSLPKEIGALIELESLDLTRNKLMNLPKEVGNLMKLKLMIIKNNQLTNLPKEIGKIKELKYLNLQNNQLKSLPKEIGDLQNLASLSLTGNPILPRGENEDMWGREELILHFGDRVELDNIQK